MKQMLPQLVYWICAALAVGSFGFAAYTMVAWDSNPYPLTRTQDEYEEVIRWFVGGVFAVLGIIVWLVGKLLSELSNSDAPRQ